MIHNDDIDVLKLLLFSPAVQFPKKSSLTNAPVTAPVNEKIAAVKTKPSMARQNSLTSSSYSHKLYSPFGIKPFERKLSATIGPTRLDSFEFISLLGEGCKLLWFKFNINALKLSNQTNLSLKFKILFSECVAYAQVYLVQIDGQLYALKAVNIHNARAHDKKSHADQYTLRNLLRERDVISISTINI